MPDPRPTLHDGAHVFATVPVDATIDALVVASVRDGANRIVVLRDEDARRLGLPDDRTSALITLEAPTGRLARVITALAHAGVEVHPFAGAREVHLLVPHNQRDTTVRVLEALWPPPVVVVGEHEIDEDVARVDRDVVWHYLSTAAYWGRWRARSDVETQIDQAWRVVGAYRRDTGAMVGFARGVGDGVSFAYLADVFVLPDARGAALGKALVAAMLDDVRYPRMRWTLFTDDAHGLYARFGFTGEDRTMMMRPPPVS